MEPTIIFEDDYVVVIDKPSGLVVNRAESVKDETVQSWFEPKLKADESDLEHKSEFWEKGGIVHRLDRDTSGVMVLAKTPKAYEMLKLQFLERKTTKKYTALIHGKLRDREGEVSKPIMRHPRDRHRFTVGGDLSRTAITEWRVIGEYKKPDMENDRVEDLTLLELMPHTGRTHQLRVHMQYLHHPIVSDRVYGFKKTWVSDLAWCPRLFLHATHLEFMHPEDGRRVIFDSPLPTELKQTLANLVN